MGRINGPCDIPEAILEKSTLLVISPLFIFYHLEYDMEKNQDMVWPVLEGF